MWFYWLLRSASCDKQQMFKGHKELSPLKELPWFINSVHSARTRNQKLTYIHCWRSIDDLAKCQDKIIQSDSSTKADRQRQNTTIYYYCCQNLPLLSILQARQQINLARPMHVPIVKVYCLWGNYSRTLIIRISVIQMLFHILKCQNDDLILCKTK